MIELKPRFPKTCSNQLDLFASEELPLPNSPYAMGRLLEERGRVSEASRLYHRAIEIEDHVPESYCNIGILESRMGRRVEALAAFAHALTIRPLFVEARYNMALEYLGCEDYLLAELHIEIAIQLEPETPELHFCKAMVEIGKDEFAGALDALENFRNLAPDERVEEVGALERMIEYGSKSSQSPASPSELETGG